MASSIYTLIWSHNHIRTVDWSEYILDFSYSGSPLIHHPRIRSKGTILAFACNGLFALNNQLILHHMKSNTQPSQ